MDVRMPDGTIVKNVPEGTTKEQLRKRYGQYRAKIAYNESKAARQGKTPEEYSPTNVPAGENFSAGAGKFFADIGKGAQQFGARVGIGDVDKLQAEVAEMRQRDAPLLKTGAGTAGYLATGIGVGAPVLAVPGANTVAGAGIYGASLGALQPTTSAKETVTNTVLGGGLGASGQAVGQRVSQAVSNRIAGKQSQQVANAVRDQTLAEARKAGYVIPPSTTNPTVKNRIIESVSGKAATKQSAQIKNQRITNDLVRRELNMGKDAPITLESLGAIRKKAGSVYGAIKQSGDIVPDSQYIDDLSNLTRSADEIAESFPDLNIAASAEIKALQDGLLRDKFSSNAALELIKQLRKNASSNLKWTVDDPAKRALGLAQREAAGIVEDQLIRHLENTGRKSLAAQFSKARELIAKTHSVEEALNDSTGNVIASKLAAQLRKGKPLSGNLQTAGRFGQAFKEVAGEPTGSAGVSALDPVVGGAGGLAMVAEPSGMAATALAYPLARYAGRATLLSRPYQNAFLTPNYAPGNALRALEATAPLAPAAGVLIPGYIGQ